MEKSYQILAEGTFGMDEVKTTFFPHKVRYTEEQSKEIERIWERREELFGKGKIYLNKTLLRLLSHRVEEEKLYLSLGLTNFKEFLATNLYERDGRSWKDAYEADTLSNPLITTVVTETGDGRLVYEKRGARVLKYNGLIHVTPSGFALYQRTEAVRIFKIALKHLEEELGIFEDELLDIKCIGLVMELPYHVPVLIFKAKVALHSSDILKRPKEHGWEHEEIKFLEKERISSFIRENEGKMVPTACAALMLLLRMELRLGGKKKEG